MIQSLFPKQKNAIEQWQPVAALSVVAYTMYLYFTDSIILCNKVLTTYFAVDILFAQPEAAMHHTLCLLSLSCKDAYGFSDTEAIIMLKPMIKTEVSTIFLLLKIMYEQHRWDNRIVKTLYYINDLLFIATFVKTRIWDLTFYSMLDPEVHQFNRLYLQDSILRNLHFYVGFFGLYVMNLYWFSIICRKMFKELVANTQLARMNTALFAERVLSWTMFLTVIPFAHIARNVFERGDMNVNDASYYVSGIAALSIASHLYHSKKHRILESGKQVIIINNIKVDGISNLDNDASIEFFFDAGAIHFKSMMSLIAIGSDRGWSSMMLHSGCFLGSYLYASSRTQIVQNEDQENTKHMNVLTAFTIVPCFHDLLCIMCAVDDRIFQMKIAMTIAALVTIMKVKPFYNLNHIAVHVFVILQTWIIANAIGNK
jgi:hypothetical protein